MEKRTFGKPGAPAVLLVSDRSMSAVALHNALAALEKNYLVLSPAFSEEESIHARVQALEDWIQKDFTGRVWAAYGLREGGLVLLELLCRNKVRIRTAVTEGVQEMPSASLKAFPGKLYFWYGTKDRKTKRVLKTLRKDLPSLRTVSLKKLRSGQDFPSIRPDLMVKRLEKAFGKARTVSVSTVINASRPQLWRLIFDRPETGRISRRLTDGLPLEREEETYTQVVEGRTPLLSHWSHLTRLDSLGSGATKFTDQVEVSAGFLTGGAAKFAGLYLKRQQKKRIKQLKKFSK